MLAEIGEIILSPAGLAVGVIYAIFSQIIVQSLTLVFGKSKNAILRFVTERSKNQQEIRRVRVSRMRKNMKTFHRYVAQLNFHLHMVAVAWTLTGICVLGALLVKQAGTVNDPITYVFLVLGGVTSVLSVTLLFQALAVQQDLIRSVLLMPPPDDDDDKAPL